MFSMTALLCLTVYGVASVEQPAPGQNLAVMSFNIRDGTYDDGDNRWENRRSLVFDVLRKYDCDIVGLQEAYRFQIDQICDALRDYAWIGVGRDDGKDKGEHSAILYRKDRIEVAEEGTFWFSDTPESPGSVTWGNACTRVCTWGRFVIRKSGKAFYVYNLHLDHVSQPSREKSVILLERRIEERRHPDSVIVTGDFNAGESNPVIAYLKGLASLAGTDGIVSSAPVVLVDTFRSVNPQAAQVGTSHQFKGARSSEKIDYIFTQSDLEAFDAKILYDADDSRYPSDHFPIMTALSFASSSSGARSASH
jgi:endonuclease/exonuclease/phosphatase family metal-dependent hydrolase